ncbi:hypothetical protein [Streptomyces longwoodensis]|uniref:hypothetical protein n=1 Tax=Streptomyces longwoodensis TaxID=68231 RepID=UPI0036E43496
MCERLECPQRAAPPLGHPLRVGPNGRRVGALPSGARSRLQGNAAREVFHLVGQLQSRPRL